MSEYKLELNKKNADKKTVKKRKDIENKLSGFIDLVQPTFTQESTNFMNNCVSFIVNSSTDHTKMYNVSIINGSDGIQFECNCGDRWAVTPKRNNCKHIGGVISSFIEIYVKNHFNKMASTKRIKYHADTDVSHKPEENMNDIIEMFKTMTMK